MRGPTKEKKQKRLKPADVAGVDRWWLVRRRPGEERALSQQKGGKGRFKLPKAGPA